MKTVVITQSNYIPWRGYFAMIAQADELIVLDCVQYTRRDWRNRNQIKTPSGIQWLTIPVEVKGKYLQAIDETRIADPAWAAAHVRSLQANYRRAQAYESAAPWIFDLLEGAAKCPMLTEVNIALLSAMCGYLGISTPIRQSTDVLPRSELVAMSPTDRLLHLSLAACATNYLSGPAAQSYLDTGRFEQAGISVEWMDYSGFPDYQQCWGDFESKVSIVDLLLNCPVEPRSYLVRSKPAVTAPGKDREPGKRSNLT